MDSYTMGDTLADLVGELVGDDAGDDVGRSRHRIERIARKHGMVAMSRQQAQQLAQAAAVNKANATGIPQTVGSRLATSDQRLEVLPLGAVALAALAGSVAALTVNVQRPIQPYRLILQAADVTTGQDLLFSVGTSNIVLGAHNLFASPGVIAPATGFSRDAWGTEILSVPMLQGGVVRVDLTKLAATANALVVSGMLLGYAAST